jgi:hypothetical protein
VVSAFRAIRSAIRQDRPDAAEPGAAFVLMMTGTQ